MHISAYLDRQLYFSDEACAVHKSSRRSYQTKPPGRFRVTGLLTSVCDCACVWWMMMDRDTTQIASNYCSASLLPEVKMRDMI